MVAAASSRPKIRHETIDAQVALATPGVRMVALLASHHDPDAPVPAGMVVGSGIVIAIAPVVAIRSRLIDGYAIRCGVDPSGDESEASPDHSEMLARGFRHTGRASMEDVLVLSPEWELCSLDEAARSGLGSRLLAAPWPFAEDAERLTIPIAELIEEAAETLARRAPRKVPA